MKGMGKTGFSLKKKPDDSQAVRREYLAYIESVRGCSPRTVESYKKDLFRYANYCENHGIVAEAATPYEVQNFITDLSAERAASSSVNRCLSSIRGIYRWMVRFNKRNDDPCAGLRNVKTPVTLPSVLWEKEMADFAALPESTGILWPARDKALIMTMYSAGLRISELVSLSMNNVSPALEDARIIGKGGKERYVFFSEEAKEALADYLPERVARLKMADIKGVTDALFISKKGQALSIPGVRWIIARYAQQSGLEKRVHPHTMRHSFATHLVNAGCDVRLVQEMLGHSSLSTTQLYTHVNIERLKKTYSAAHPHAGKTVGKKGGMLNEK
jgi:integrase/recombinase XerC